MAWSASLYGGIISIFTIIPSLLMIARIYFDTKRFRKHGYLSSSLISLGSAIGAWIMLLVAIGMVLYRSDKRIGTMRRKEDPLNIPDIESLGTPLTEATIMHSYVVPTGLWLCKASFIAMCKSNLPFARAVADLDTDFNLKRHCSKGIKILLHIVLMYVILSYVVLVLTHALWCGQPTNEWYSPSSLPLPHI